MIEVTQIKDAVKSISSNYNDLAHCISVPVLAFDVGSGKTIGTLFSLDSCTKELTERDRAKQQVDYQDCINRSESKTLSKQCMDDGLNSFFQIQKELGVDCKTDTKCVGIATAWARYATNTNEYLYILRQHNFFIKQVSQEEEGRIGYKAGKHLVKNQENISHQVFFDIGGGSSQLSFKDENNDITVIQGSYGCANFRYELENALVSKGSAEFNNRFLTIEEIHYAQIFVREKIVNNASSHDKFIDLPKNSLLYGFGANGIIKQFLNKDSASRIELDQLAHSLSTFGTYQKAEQTFTHIPSHFIQHAQYLTLLIGAILDKFSAGTLNFIDPDNAPIIAETQMFHEDLS